MIILHPIYSNCIRFLKMKQTIYFSSHIGRADGGGGISCCDPLLPFDKIVEWYRERYSRISSFEISCDAEGMSIYQRSVFKMSFLLDDMISFHQWDRDTILDRFQNHPYRLFEDILYYASPHYIHTISFQGFEYCIYSYVICFTNSNDLYERSPGYPATHSIEFMKYIETIIIRNKMKQILFAELMEKTWHPYRFMDWCL